MLFTYKSVHVTQAWIVQQYLLHCCVTFAHSVGTCVSLGVSLFRVHLVYTHGKPQVVSASLAAPAWTSLFCTRPYLTVVCREATIQSRPSRRQTATRHAHGPLQHCSGV